MSLVFTAPERPPPGCRASCQSPLPSPICTGAALSTHRRGLACSPAVCGLHTWGLPLPNTKLRGCREWGTAQRPSQNNGQAASPRQSQSCPSKDCWWRRESGASPWCWEEGAGRRRQGSRGERGEAHAAHALSASTEPTVSCSWTRSAFPLMRAKPQ